MKNAKQFTAVVERQDPAVLEKAQLIVVGRVEGTYDQCWKLAKEITKYPVIRFQEKQNVPATV